MYRHVLTNKQILYYLIGAGVSQLGNVLSGLAFLFLGYELTKSAGLTTVIAVSQAVPYLLFGLIGGGVADRVNKKSLLLILDFVRVPIILALFVIGAAGHLAFWHLLLVSFVIQSIGCFYNPAYRSLLPLITPANDRTAVNSLLDTVTRGVQVLAPVFSIGLMNAGGTIYFYTIDAISFGVSACCTLLLYKTKPVQEEVPPETEKGVFRSIWGFFIWMKGEGTIKSLFGVTFLMVFFNTWVWQVGLLLLLLEVYPVEGQDFYSLMMSWYGAGVIIVNLIIPFIWKELTLKIYLASSAVWGAGIALFGLADHLPVFFACMLICAIGLPVSGLARVYLIQTLVPDYMLGRAFSLNAVLLYGSNVLSLCLFGLLAAVMEIKMIFLGCGTMMILGSTVYLARKRFTKHPGRKTIQAFK